MASDGVNNLNAFGADDPTGHRSRNFNNFHFGGVHTLTIVGMAGARNSLAKTHIIITASSAAEGVTLAYVDHVIAFIILTPAYLNILLDQSQLLRSSRDARIITQDVSIQKQT